MDEQRVFLAISTKQNISNIPPILELASPKGDLIVWLESARSKESDWLLPTFNLLSTKGFLNQQRLDIGDLQEPAELFPSIEKLVTKWQDQNIFFIANGGTKLTTMALLTALEKWKVTILYANDRPVELWKIHQSLRNPVQKQRYKRNNLDLQDILAVNNCMLYKPETPLQLYPSREPQSLDGINTLYGVDSDLTRNLHDDHFQWFTKVQQNRNNHIYQFDTVDRISSKQHDKWLKTIETFYNSTRRYSKQLRGKQPLQQGDLRVIANNDSFRNRLKELFQSTKKLSNTVSRRVDTELTGITAPETRIGGSFEYAVGQRVISWLSQTPQVQDIISSIWRNVEICHRRDPEKIIAELDIALVLKSGIIINLECKTSIATITEKDLSARIVRAQQMSSSLSRTFICAPWFDEFKDEPWFDELLALKEKVLSVAGLNFIGFTLAKTPQADQTDSTASFENALSRLFIPYLQQV